VPQTPEHVSSGYPLPVFCVPSFFGLTPAHLYNKTKALLPLAAFFSPLKSLERLFLNPLPIEEIIIESTGVSALDQVV